MKIATIIGARPQFIKSALVSEKIRQSQFLEEFIIHTGQHYDKKMSTIFFKEMGIQKPKYNLGINQFEYGEMIGLMTKAILPILKKENPDSVLLYGDTNSTLAGSLAASTKSIPIFHIEAGLRSFNRSMFEENNRIICDHLSSLLFCPTRSAVNNLKKENISKKAILTGDIMYDAFLKYSKKISKNYSGSKFILATIHRRENINESKKLSLIFKNLESINDKIKIIMPLHPHTRSKFENLNLDSSITFIEPVGYLEMLYLLKNCEMVITDSGGLQKESYFAKKKCLVLRDQTEWIELIENGVNKLCNHIFFL